MGAKATYQLCPLCRIKRPLKTILIVPFKKENYQLTVYTPKPTWNKGKLVGQKLPLKLEEVWSIRTRLEISINL